MSAKHPLVRALCRPQSGAVFETWVFGELLRSYWHNGRRAPFYFYRDREQREVDLLIVRDGRAYPIEVKKSASPRAEDVRSFRALPCLARVRRIRSIAVTSSGPLLR